MKFSEKIAAWVVVAGVLLASVACADTFKIVGPRALALGGAFTAKVDDSSAVYWNPAALGFTGKSAERGLGATGGAGYDTFGNLISKLDSLITLNPSEIYSASASPVALQNFDISTLTEFIHRLQKFDTKTGFGLSVDAALFFAFNRFGVGMVVSGDIGAGPYLDFENVGFQDETGSISGDYFLQALAGQGATFSGNFFPPDVRQRLEDEIVAAYSKWGDTNILTGNTYVSDYLDRIEAGYLSKGAVYTPGLEDAVLTLATAVTSTKSLKDNRTGARIRGYTAVEFPLAFGVRLAPFVAIGGAFKIVQGWAVDQLITVKDMKRGSDVEKLVEMFKGKPTTTVSFDLAMLFRLPFVNLSLVAKDLNEPSLKTVGLSKVKIERKLRAGVNVHIAKLLSVTFDADLIPTHSTFNPEVKNMEVGTGVEFNVKFLQLRAGYRRNLLYSEPGNVFSVGLGVSVWVLKLDIAACISSFSAFMDKKVPNASRIEGGLSIYF